MNTNPNTHYDVLVSGGGPTGLLTAIGLKKECPDLSVGIIEPIDQSLSDGNSNEMITSNFDQRCLALSHGSLQLLDHWGVWSELKSHGWPIQTIVTSDRGHLGKTVMRARDYDLNAMGQVASLHNLGCALKAGAKQLDIAWFCPDRIESMELVNLACNKSIAATEGDIYARDNHSNSGLDSYNNDDNDSGNDKATLQATTQSKRLIKLESGQELTTDLLIVAEGGQSSTRKLLNITSDTSEYGQSAVIANVRVTGAQAKLSRQFDDADHNAFERFTTNGPIAFLPIGKQEYNVVWTQTPEQALEVNALTDEAFCERLQQEFGFAAGQIKSVSKRATYPLSLTRVERLTAPNAVLLGNTAHTIHPIAGQGFNLGVRDIGVLVFAIKKAAKSGIAIGRFDVLNDYEKNRQHDIDRIVSFTDLLVRAFGIEGRAAALTRTTGLMALQGSDTLQQWLALHFMGSHQQFNLAKEKLHD